MGNRPSFDHTGLVRYNADGSLDSGFGSGGKVTLVDTRVSEDVAIQPDGKIVLAGSALGGTSNSSLLAVRLTSGGGLDASFGTGGRTTMAFSPGSAHALAVQADGKIVAVGSFSGGTATGSDFALARWNPDGSPDASFGSGGKLTVDFFGSADGATGLAIQPDG